MTISSTVSVFGCKDFPPPEGAFVSRHLDSSGIVCNESSETWYVTCRDGRWTGDVVGNCSRVGTSSLISVVRNRGRPLLRAASPR